MIDIFSLTTNKLVEKLKEGEISSVEVCTQYIDRIKKFEKDVKAWAHLDKKELWLGYTPNEYLKQDNSTHFRGDIAQVHVWNKSLNPEDVKSLHKKLPTEGLIISKDFNEDIIESENTELLEDIIICPNSILPHRIEGKMRCLPHEDEGIVGGVFKKGATTAANEYRYVMQMQKGKINHKEDGIKQLQYELVNEEILTPWAKMLNIKL